MDQPTAAANPLPQGQRLKLLAYALPSAGAGCLMWLVTINLLRFGTDTLLLDASSRSMPLTLTGGVNLSVR